MTTEVSSKSIVWGSQGDSDNHYTRTKMSTQYLTGKFNHTQYGNKGWLWVVLHYNFRFQFAVY